MAGQATKMAIQVASVVILARLLTPHDYGLVAMIVAVTGVADILRDFGLSSAAIQAKTLSRGQRDNLFWINTGTGFLLAVVTFFAAPLFVSLYDRPELEPIARVLGLAFLVNGMTTQYRASLTRDLRFMSVVGADVLGSLSGLAVGVVAALSGARYWSLVAQQLTQLVVMGVLLVIAARWRPRRPKSGEPMGGLLRFGWHLVGSQVIGYIGNNTDTLVIGTRFGPTSLGLYNRGYQLLMPPISQALAPVTNVALPILSRLHDDRPRYDRFVMRGQIVLGFTLVAGLGAVAGATGPIVDVLLGDRWHAVTPVLRLMAVAGALQTLSFVGYWVYISRGLTADLRRYTLVSTALRITCILVGSIWGVVGVAAGFALAPTLAWPLSLWWLSRRTQLPVRALLKGAARIIVLAVAVGAAAFAGCQPLGQEGVLGLLAAGGAAVTAYVIVVLVLPRWRADARDVFEVIRQGVTR